MRPPKLSPPSATSGPPHDIELLRKAISVAANAMLITDREGRIQWANAAFTRLTGYSASEVIGLNPRVLKSGQHSSEFYAQLWQTILAGEVWQGEMVNRRKDGSCYHEEMTITPVRNGDATIHHFIVVKQDITERKQAEVALRAKTEELDGFFNAALDLWCIADTDGRFLRLNRIWEITLGHSQETLLAQPFLSFVHPEDRLATVATIEKLSAQQRVLNFVNRYRCANGSYRWLEWRSIPVGKLIYATARDITERKETEAALREAQSFATAALDSLSAHIAILDAQGVVLAVNQSWRRFAEQNPPVHTPVCEGANYIDVCDAATGSDAATARAFAGGIRDVIAGRVKEFVLEYSCHSPSEQRWFDGRVTRFAATGPIRVVVVHKNCTARKLAELALRTSEERFRELAETVADAFWITDVEKSRLLYISPAYERIWGRSCASLYANPRDWLTAVHPEDQERVRLAATTRQKDGSYDEEYRILRPDGTQRWIRDRAYPVRNAAGETERVVGVARDVTERRQLEEQLRQAQKLEAIGQLAGGVAHDFNNLLSVIRGNADLALASGDEVRAETREFLGQIVAASERAAGVTRQLLLFSRRQMMQLLDLDLNEVVTSLAKMLQRVIREDVQLQLRLHPKPLITRADAAMLDQILLNLAVNARDAMPEGGHLLIETAQREVDATMAQAYPDAAPGRYVWLSVSDTGTGIAPEVLPRIFEPFFTTKEAGKGTGLGLATVFGIVKQHHGWLKVYSEPGQGTNFQVFLPASDAKSAHDTSRVARPPRGGTEVILLAEDDDALRLLTRVVLERNGYRVIEAKSGVAALELWRQHRETIALVITDLVMPGGLGGLQLAEALNAERTGVRVIFTSGYSAEIAGRGLELRNGENFLQKPAAPAQLLETVRNNLDAR